MCSCNGAGVQHEALGSFRVVRPCSDCTDAERAYRRAERDRRLAEKTARCERKLREWREVEYVT